MTQDLISTIRARHAASTAKVQRLRNQIEIAERELQEFATALKVFQALSGEPDQPAAPTGKRLAVMNADVAIGYASGIGANAPVTMPELIIEALKAGPMQIASVTARVTELSDKPVDANNIRSTAWRMWKAGRIEKTGDEYHLIGSGPNEKGEAEASPETGEVSASPEVKTDDLDSLFS